MPRNVNLRARWIATVLAPIIPMITLASGAAASTATYAATVSATATGTTVTAATTITASAPTTATDAGICARGADGVNHDFVKRSNVALSTTGTTITATQTLPAGKYSYWTCLDVNGTWTTVGLTKNMYVSVAPLAIANTMPVGNLPGLTQVFSDDFTTNLAQGGFPGSYANKWQGYTGFPDTNKTGVYDNSIISVHDGNLDEYLHQSGGTTRVAAPVPLVGGHWGGQTYGRFSVRFKADAISGYKTAFLLWPDSGNWNDGEIDFPEASLTSTMFGFNHCPGNPSKNCLWTDTGVSYGNYHTLTIDWKPNSLTYLIDNRVVASTTSNVPNRPMHWVMQTESTGTPAATGHLLIDWATIYAYTP